MQLYCVYGHTSTYAISDRTDVYTFTVFKNNFDASSPFAINIEVLRDFS